MPVEFIGIARTADRSETITEVGPAVQPDYLYGLARAHEQSGFIAPTIAARKFATIDAFHPGRIALHVITGGDDGDQARDGDFADKATRYQRTDEFLDVVKLEWSSPERFDHAGDFYRVAGAWSSLRPGGGHLPVYFGGASTLLIRGYEPLADAAAYASLIRLVHDQVGDDIDSYRARVAA
jgi:alkanesulfonate monooxygenase